MNNASNYDGPIQIDDDSDYNNEEIYSNQDGMCEDISTNQYITHQNDYKTQSSNPNDVFSESRVPVTSIDG